MDYKFTGKIKSNDAKPFEGECMVRLKGLLVVNVHNENGNWKLAVPDTDVADRIKVLPEGSNIRFNATAKQVVKDGKEYKNWAIADFTTDMTSQVRDSDSRPIMQKDIVTQHSIEQQVIFKEYCECRRNEIPHKQAMDIVTRGWAVARGVLVLEPEPQEEKPAEQPTETTEAGPENAPEFKDEDIPF